MRGGRGMPMGGNHYNRQDRPFNHHHNQQQQDGMQYNQIGQNVMSYHDSQYNFSSQMNRYEYFDTNGLIYLNNKKKVRKMSKEFFSVKKTSVYSYGCDLDISDYVVNVNEVYIKDGLYGYCYSHYHTGLQYDWES